MYYFIDKQFYAISSLPISS